MSLETAVRRTIINQGIVPYDQQTESQRRELIGRISSLLDIRILRAKILDNWIFIEASIPLNPKTHELKILRQRLNKIKKMFRNDMIPFVKETERVFNLLLTASTDGTDELDLAGHFASEFIHHIHTVPVDKLEVLSNVAQSVASGEFQALTENDHEKEMILFGQYCMGLSQSGRKNITKKDLQKFKNK